MPSLGEIRRRMWMFAHWRRVDRDLDAELRSHEELLRARAGRDGANEAAVQADARRRMGSTLRIREQTHDALGWRWYEDLVQDLRYAPVSRPASSSASRSRPAGRRRSSA